MEVFKAVKPGALPVVVLKTPDAAEHQCFAQVQVGCFAHVQIELWRRHKVDQAVIRISLCDVLDLRKLR